MTLIGARIRYRAALWLAAVLAVTTLGVTGWPAQADAAASDMRLEISRTDPALLDALHDRLPEAGVVDVVDSANRTARSCSAPVSHRVASFCWNSGDGSVAYWMPQGITSSSDAYPGGTVDGREVLITSWYDTGSSGINRGVRLSFVDMSDPVTPDYRHILLVEPYWSGSEPNYRRVAAHAGGLVWYGDKLYVNNTYDGMRVFDMDDLMRVSTGDSGKIGRQSDGRYMAHDYLYILPQSGRYVPSTVGGEPRVRYSQSSLDRTTSPDSMVVSEYGNPGDGTRIIRFDLDEANHEIRADSDGYARADWSRVTSFRSVQGATAVNGTFYVQRSNGDGSRGDLFTWRPGNYAEPHDGTVPIGPEDLSYWSQKGQLWSLSEYAGKRYVYASRLSSW
ncbi:hypothetical protein LX16_3681 [Stackebrandtia albiflava]|uniref:Secreted protein n=1 Tax=Stackebrandtia albiflava TaxID=406432 RepID=A0A562V4U7_9ACTN|nr:hypothetical protein [Stackebrandtia albiflava]TWJ12914.1 hypothetical protein LX16_3681 [Stackebrandtia albiflava]